MLYTVTMAPISSCTLDCQDTCSIVVQKNTRGKFFPTGNPDHPFTRGFICPKGRRALERITSPLRITTPLIRTGGKSGTTLQPASWDRALDLVAEKIRALCREPATMLHVRYYGFRGVFSEGSNYLFDRLGAASTHGALCDNAGCAAFVADFGALEMNAPEELLNAGQIVNWGKDLSRSSLHLGALISRARKRGSGVTTISPGGDGNRPFTDHTICIRPGTDRFLAAAVIKQLDARGLILDRAAARATGMAPFLRILRNQDLASLLTACDCSRSDLDRLVNIYSDPRHRPAATLMGWGIQRYLFGGENVRYINALAFLSGQLGIPGGGSYFNVSSGRNINTGWAARGGSPCRTLSLPRIGQEILTADPPIRFLLADGTNFVNQAPDSQTIERALETVDFKVVVDAFMTDTARLADVILPCALDHEREEILGSCFHNMINYSGAVFSPAGEARSDFHIMGDLANRLGIDFPQREEILATCLDTPFVDRSRDHGSLLAQLKQTGFLETDHPDIAWKDLNFAHPDGRYRLPAKLNPEPPAPPGFPLHLLSLVNRDFIHSQIPESAQKGLPRVWINPESPVLPGLDRSRPVFLATILGRMAVKVCFTGDLHPADPDHPPGRMDNPWALCQPPG